jgi:DNA sulfur modification protein DndD
MILERLTLRNFGLFRGEQSFNLAPAQRNGRGRPIVLFGGINGGGKTTLFYALQLALYGPRARCSKRAGLSYEDFLRQSIHHGVPQHQGALVAVSFHYTRDGQEHDYEVRRSWQVEEGRVRETLVVLEDGLPSQALARGWAQLVEELMPLEISQLFFFDGEKIRALAEDGGSSAALGAAVKALLGLDLVGRLIGDAAVVQTRLASQVGPAERRAEVEGLEQQVQALRGDLETLRSERAGLENRLQRARAEQVEAEEALAAAGGRHWDERHSRQQRLEVLASTARDLESRLAALAAGELPLALVPDLLDRVGQQDAREQDGTEAELFVRLLAERDEQLVAVLRSLRLGSDKLRRVDEHLAADREARRPKGPVEQRLGFTGSTRTFLKHLQRRLPELQATAQALLDDLDAVQTEREDLERALKATPSETELAAVTERIKTATGNLRLLEHQAGQLDEALETKKAALKEVERKLRRFWEGDLAREFEHDDRQRMMVLAGRTQSTMKEFLRRATAGKIDRLSGLITESFRFLARKQTLVEQILIDPSTFAVTVVDTGGHPLPRERLSEGEKQVFAVSLLWGLARAAARPLPAVIDTPMARLDAAHRQHLIERYFPSASHQVVLLSTDTEVDRHYYELLRPAIARTYHLRYDDQTRSTIGEEGYFWKEEARS